MPLDSNRDSVDEQTKDEDGHRHRGDDGRPSDRRSESSSTTPPSFDVTASKAAFQKTVYPLLREHCVKCHSAEPEGRGQRPLHASSDLSVAHDEALSKVSLRQAGTSKLVRRIAEEGHNCWSDCAKDGAAMQAQVEAWANAVKSSLPTNDLPVVDGPISEEQVRAIVAADREKRPPEEAQYVRYASLHTLHNQGASPDDMNAARAGLSKVLNSTARYAPKLAHPVAVDEHHLVYRFDVRSYWGYRRAFRFGGAGNIQADPARGIQIWNRVAQGNINADGPDAEKPNVKGFFPDFVDATQLAYTLTRPDVYNEIMSIPILGSMLEAELGVDHSKGLESYQYMTVDDAITINQRLIWRAPINTGYFYRTVDQFSFTKFVFYDKPMPEFMGPDMSQMRTTDLTPGTPIQAQAGEVIFSLPNKLQGYAIWGAGNERNLDAFTFVVVDPRRGGPVGPFSVRFNEGANWRLLNGASCMGCHVEGLNRAQDDMRPYLAKNRDKFDHATMSRLEKLYPGTEVMSPQIENDRQPFAEAMREIREHMIVGTSDKNLYVEPVLFLFETAQKLYGYKNTQSN